ncbi:DUF2388 domain-containing protein [Stutzerimonas urumqiensis]|uniref:DUF2388 domain-containing protein n=1 Tax=Stutzerimonas urumqiensis TaxID=638269 RepID=UPI003BA9865D
MRSPVFLLALLFVAGPAGAFGVTTEGVAATSFVSSQLTSLPFEDRLALARDDAASFVASGGELAGARLTEALRLLRDTYPQLDASDFELAQALLVQ